MITMGMTNFNGTKRAGYLNMAVFGDVHLGNALTKANETIQGLIKMFPRNKATAELDLIVIEGDLFDEGLMYNSEYLPNIQTWMIWLINRCVEYNIVLRCLEGTPSHDNKQPKNFLTLIEAMGVDIDFKYIDDLLIEEHPVIGTVLYVPDEWSTSPDHTYQSAKSLMATYGLTQVDYAIMHGAFEYQLPPIAAEVTHNSKAWQELVRYAIFVGHIHQRSKRGKIEAAGSFDRHTHGDEAPKGHLRATLTSEGINTTFVENLLAKKFITIDCRDLSVEDAMTKIKKQLDIPKGSFIRLLALTTDNTSTAASFLAAEYPHYHWKVEIKSSEAETNVQKLATMPKVSLFSRSITPQNIESVVMDYASKRYVGDMALDEESINKLKKALGALCKGP